MTAGEHFAGDVALEAAQDLGLGLAFGGAAGDLVLGGLVEVHADQAIRHRAVLAWRYPSRCGRWQSVRPEDAGIEATPHKRAKERSVRSQAPLSPAVTAPNLPVPSIPTLSTVPNDSAHVASWA